MKNSIKFLSVIVLAGLMSFALSGGKYSTKNAKISFYSHTSVEDIKADNNAVASVLNSETGDLAFSVPMQNFNFEKALMQKHFNSKKFLDTKKHPRSTFKGKIENLDQINLNKSGSYDVKLSGKLTIKGETNEINETGKITVTNDGLTMDTKFKIKLADYGIAFEKGKPSTNIAKSIEVNVHSVYKK